ncbi:hypothetical protein CEUSTIGMA_g7280.t1 [Chlamydomonas eustigma]|uniref:non-specific serine/threonine protein kinase n=1 Tax=Chlamydomonas eustigma TaxID=1157962 RepID=A0A250XAQ0_9CHLO|nr:hypothetical protein CEUSTIGMA_g7280.t1 [Chlamydomonas eustigma]|eukprot:GAX79840.1 hypothetical protein CEUSTIGMA_g7280.t1 [Chlamydomonas eustigma]
MQNYSNLQAVGQGQFGVAYKATNKQDGQLYCIKRIPMKGGGDEQATTLKEAQLLSSLDHPNIIGYKECFIDTDDSLCIVTAFCEEGDLFNRIREKDKKHESFDEDEIMDMFIQIASALMYIHSKKILHRDLKTQNIFIARGSIMKLGDFGIAKVLEKTDSFATTVTGTPYYMAPEICSSQPYSSKSDIWSLGCVLYELCTLKHAFAADSLLSLVYQIVKGNFPPIPEDKFSPGLSRLVNAMLVRDPNSRPNLQQVFQMPYVQEHVQRYHKQEKKRAGRAVQSATRRRQVVEEGRAMGPPENWETLTPKERMAKKREVEAQKRELELKLAAMNMNKDKMQIAGRKTKMVYESNIGLPGAKQNRKPDVWDVNTMSDTSARRQGIGSFGDSMVNMDTMPSTSTLIDPHKQTVDWQRQAGRGGPARINYGNDSMRAGVGNDTVLMGTVPSGGSFLTSAGGDTMVNLGTMNLGGITSNGLPTLPGMKRQPMGTIQSVPSSPAEPPASNRFRSVQVTPSKADDYNSDYASEYESDFEDYDPDDSNDVVHQRMKIVNNIEELGRTMGSNYNPLDTMQERVGNTVKNSKAQALREKCQNALGYHFGEVYTYLRRARTSQSPPDEREVQRHLLELVGSKKELMPGCFLVDQLVFQESMFQ